RQMKLAMVRPELAKTVSPQAIESEIIADRARGTTNFPVNQRMGAGRVSSSRRASRIAAAGISGSTVRALAVQFKNVANTKVPRTQRANSSESASLRFL